MRIFNGVDSFRERNEKIVLALGNFDGVHLGHQHIIQKTVLTAGRKGLKSAALVFTPHPLTVLGGKGLPLLTSLEERAGLFKSLGLDYLLLEPFTLELSRLQPQSFVKRYFTQILNIDTLTVGYDYTFGVNGSGSAADLKKMGKYYGFCVEVCSPVLVDGKPVSSSLIKKLIDEGNVVEAAKHLNYYFRRKGIVIKGDGRGKALGYPTANLQFAPNLLRPKNGVYLTAVLYNNELFFGLTNIGIRPTFAKKELSIETFVFNLSKNLYGEELTLLFLQKVREELFFEDFKALQNQIAADTENAQKLIETKFKKINTGFFSNPKLSKRQFIYIAD
ncbi:MAG: bifunctional riboflavin kinase/FAD synthetase [Firmicutes bacterium]|nr:bifunctional riboflavin kinase/FAD synthetase [Bacillota bacterium]